jgi:DDE superfamily endonuclease
MRGKRPLQGTVWSAPSQLDFVDAESRMWIAHGSMRKEDEYQRCYPDSQHRKTKGPVEELPVPPRHRLTQTLELGVVLTRPRNAGDGLGLRAAGIASQKHLEGNTINGREPLQVGNLRRTGAEEHDDKTHYAHTGQRIPTVLLKDYVHVLPPFPAGMRPAPRREHRRVGYTWMPFYPKGGDPCYSHLTILSRSSSPSVLLFSRRVWRHVPLLVVGAILAPGRRMVSTVLRTVGLSHEQHFQTYHRVLNRAVWSSLGASRIQLRLLVSTFAATGPVVLGIDETIERRRGAKIAATGIYRDPVRSSHSHFVKVNGLLLSSVSCSSCRFRGLVASGPCRF